MKNKRFLILFVGFCWAIANFTLSSSEHSFAFEPIGPAEAPPSQPLEQPTFTVYQNSTFGMSINYPSNWTKHESSDGSSTLIVQFTDKPVANDYWQNTSLGVLNITGRPLTLNASTSDLSLYLQEQLNVLRTTLPSFNLIETRMTNINAHQQNIPATMTSYSYRDPLHNEVYVLIVDIFSDDRYYSLKYSAEPGKFLKNNPILLEMIESFEITQAPNTTMIVPPSEIFNTYENDTMGISIEYPENWMYEEVGDGVTFNLPGGLVGIAVFPSIYSSSQEAVTNLTNMAIKEVSGFSLILSESIDLGGVNFTSSNHLVFTLNGGLGEVHKVKNIVTVSGGKVYLIQYLADPAVYSLFEPTIQKMIDSFKITGAPDAAKSSPTPTPS